MKFFTPKFSRSTVYNKACMCNKQLLIDIQLLGLLKNDHRHEAEIHKAIKACVEILLVALKILNNELKYIQESFSCHLILNCIKF